LDSLTGFYHKTHSRDHDKISLMKRLSLLSLLILAPILSLLAAPPPVAVAQSQLLANGGFDSFDSSGLANSWSRWWEEVPNPGNGSLDYAGKPDWAPENNPVFTQGGQSQHIGTTWNPWHAGVFQVINVPPGAQIHISAMGRVFANAKDFPEPSDKTDDARMQIGADPNGSTDWWTGNVQWSGAGNPHDTWQTFTLDVTAGPSGKVTIFLGANFKGESRFHQDTWWENASAQIVNIQPTAVPTNIPATAAPTSAAPRPTATLVPPTAAPTDVPVTATVAPPTEVPTQAQTATPDTRPGSICVVSFEDTNGNGSSDAGEKLIAGSVVKLLGLTQATYTTDGANEPYCFANLPAGPYQISVALPAGYAPTTGNLVVVNVVPGAPAQVPFGAQSSRLVPADGTTATPEPSSSGSGSGSATILIIAGLGVALLLVAGGIAGFFFLRSRFN
jgi:SdrD B-like domain